MLPASLVLHGRGVADLAGSSVRLTPFRSLADSCSDDLDFFQGSVFAAGFDKPSSLHNLHTTLDPAKDGVVAVKPPRGGEGGEEEN